MNGYCLPDRTQPSMVVICRVNVIALAHASAPHVFLCLLLVCVYYSGGEQEIFFSKRIMLNYSKPFSVQHAKWHFLTIWNSLCNVFLVDIQNL